MASSQCQIGTRTGNGRTLSPTFFFTSFTEHCLKQKFPWQVILLLDGYRAHCSSPLTFRHRASCILGQAFHYSPEIAFYIFNQQIYFII